MSTSWTAFAGHDITGIMLKKGIISFSYRGGTEEGIDAVHAEEAVAKMMEDGRIVIIRGGKKYDISGRLIEE